MNMANKAERRSREQKQKTQREKKIEVIYGVLPGTDTKVLIQVDTIKAEGGCFLGLIPFQNWTCAYQSGYDRSMIYPIVVAGMARPCFVYNCPFEDYEVAELYVKWFKNDNSKGAKYKERKYNPESIERIDEHEITPYQGKDPTATIALMHVMEEEMIDLLERDNPRLVRVHVLRDQGYSGKEIGDLICRGTSSVYRDLDRIKEIQRVYRKKVRS